MRTIPDQWSIFHHAMFDDTGGQVYQQHPATGPAPPPIGGALGATGQSRPFVGRDLEGRSSSGL